MSQGASQDHFSLHATRFLKPSPLALAPSNDNPSDDYFPSDNGARPFAPATTDLIGAVDSPLAIAPFDLAARLGLANAAERDPARPLAGLPSAVEAPLFSRRNLSPDLASGLSLPRLIVGDDGTPVATPANGEYPNRGVAQFASVPAADFNSDTLPLIITRFVDHGIAARRRSLKARLNEAPHLRLVVANADRDADIRVLRCDAIRNVDDLSTEHLEGTPASAASPAIGWTDEQLNNISAAPYWIVSPPPPPNANCLPQIFISVAQADLVWARLMSEALKPRLADLGHPGPYLYMEGMFGTPIGARFVPHIVERILTAPAGVVLLSMSYFASSYCKELELPLLLRRWHAEQMPLYLLFVDVHQYMSTPIRYPVDNSGRHEELVLGGLVDDRQCHPDDLEDLRKLSLRALRERGHGSAVNQRILGIGNKLLEKLPRLAKCGPTSPLPTKS